MHVKPHTFYSLSDFQSGIILRNVADSKQNRHNYHSLEISALEVRCARVIGPRFESPRAVVFITTAAAIYSLGHGLQTFTAVPRST